MAPDRSMEAQATNGEEGAADRWMPTPNGDSSMVCPLWSGAGTTPATIKNLRDVSEEIALRQDLHVQVGTPFSNEHKASCKSGPER